MQQLASDVVIGVLGWTATVCFAMILVPQIVLNQMRKSCEGFSISLLLLWHIGAAAVFPFFMFEEEPLPLMLQGGLFTIASVLCEVQFYAFRPGQERPPATWKLWALGITSFGLSAGFILGLMALFKYVDHSSLKWLIDGIGSIISSLCFALGFIPQINLMFTTRSSEGFSVGVSMLDLTGSLLSIIVLVLEAGGKADPEAIMPYGIIVGMQSLLLFLALVVYPDPKRWEHTRTTIAAALDALRCPTVASRLRGEKPLEKDLELPVSMLDFTRHTSMLSSAGSSIIDLAAMAAAPYPDADAEGADGFSPPLSSRPSADSLCSLEAGEQCDEEDDEGRTEQQEPPTPLSSYGGIRSRLSSVDFRLRTGEGDDEEEEEDISSEEECSDVDEEEGGNGNGYALYYDMETGAGRRKQQPGSDSAAGAVAAAAFALSSREQQRRLGASNNSGSGGRKTVSGAGPSRPEPSQ